MSQISDDVDSVVCNEEAVTNYLKLNPQFFVGKNQLIESLIIPHECGSAKSLLTHQLDTLRKSNKELKNKLDELMTHASKNEDLYSMVSRISVSLLELKRFAKIFDILDKELLQLPACSTYSFIYPGKELFVKHPNVYIEHPADVGVRLSALFRKKTSLIGQFSSSDYELFFKDSAKFIHSAAVMPLVYDNFKALLILGSFEDNGFEADTGTLFLDQLSAFMARVCHRLLAKNHTTPSHRTKSILLDE